MITEFDIVSEVSTNWVVNVVNDRIREGWIPYGPMVIEKTTMNTVRYHQTIIKTSTESVNIFMHN